uniref:ATP-dependent DNA helicase n=1 Tax=Octopus bimaculoides TaxID=37653 RepID=A0A0L8FIJ7_OCTBM
MQTVLETTILTGKANGEDVFVPKIPLIPSDTQIDLKRLQFPLRLSFAMRINKAQGQTLDFCRQLPTTSLDNFRQTLPPTSDNLSRQPPTISPSSS